MIPIFLGIGASVCLGLIFALVFYAWHDRTDW